MNREQQEAVSRMNERLLQENKDLRRQLKASQFWIKRMSKMEKRLAAKLRAEGQLVMEYLYAEYTDMDKEDE